MTTTPEETPDWVVKVHLDGRGQGNNKIWINDLDITRLVLTKGLSIELQTHDSENWPLATPVVHLQLAPDHIELTGDHVEFLTQIAKPYHPRLAWRQRRRIRKALAKIREQEA